MLRCYGRDGLQALIREHVGSRRCFEGWVDDDRAWEVSAPRHFSTVCFRHERADNDELARAGDGDRRASSSRRRGCAGQSVIRLAIGNAAHAGGRRPVAWEVLRECAR